MRIAGQDSAHGVAPRRGGLAADRQPRSSDQPAIAVPLLPIVCNELLPTAVQRACIKPPTHCQSPCNELLVSPWRHAAFFVESKYVAIPTGDGGLTGVPVSHARMVRSCPEPCVVARLRPTDGSRERGWPCDRRSRSGRSASSR